MPKAINSKYKKFRWGRVVIMKFDKKFYYNSFRRMFVPKSIEVLTIN